MPHHEKLSHIPYKLSAGPKELEIIEVACGMDVEDIFESVNCQSAVQAFYYEIFRVYLDRNLCRSSEVFNDSENEVARFLGGIADPRVLVPGDILVGANTIWEQACCKNGEEFPKEKYHLAVFLGKPSDPLVKTWFPYESRRHMNNGYLIFDASHFNGESCIESLSILQSAYSIKKATRPLLRYFPTRPDLREMFFGRIQAPSREHLVESFE